MSATFIGSVSLNPNRFLDRATFPGNLGFTQNLSVEFETPVTFFVGENGSGKSTLIEAMAVLSQLPICGGGTNELGLNHAFAEHSLLADSLSLAFLRQPKDRYFFRAETASHFASLLEQRQRDLEFKTSSGAPADPYKRYGGKSLHLMSHGEAFLSTMQNRFRNGLFFMDEPESALSPQRQLTLLALISDLAQTGESQFFIATHSPILLSFPGATLISFDDGELAKIAFKDTTHYKITHGILSNPERYWKHLSPPND